MIVIMIINNHINMDNDHDINSNHAKDTNYIYMYSGVFGWRYRPDKTN